MRPKMIERALEPVAIDDGRVYKYQAFISYKRSVDRAIATALFEAIETYSIPPRVQRELHVGKRCGRLFKDDDELAAASDLPESLRTALDDSKYLIVICSPAAQNAPWIELEIQQFLSRGRGDRILAALVEGEPSTSFPPSLATLNPLAVDLRAATFRARKRRIQIEKLRLLARILGCEFDALRQRDAQRSLSRLRWALAGAAVVAIGAIATLLYVTALRRTSEERRIAAEARLATASLSMSQLSGLIENRVNAGASLDDIKTDLTKLMADTQRALAETATPGRDEKLIEISSHLFRAEIAEGHHDHQGAVREYLAGLAIGQSALRLRPQDVPLRLDVTMLHGRLYDALSKAGDIERAKEHLNSAIAQGEGLFRERPQDLGVRTNLAAYYLARGDLELKNGDLGAEATYAKLVELSSIETPQQRFVDLDLRIAEGHRKLGAIALGKKDTTNAVDHYAAVISISEPGLTEFPTRVTTRRLAEDYLSLSFALQQANKPGDSIRMLEKAIVSVEHYHTEHPESFMALFDLWAMHGNLVLLTAQYAGIDTTASRMTRFLTIDDLLQKELLSASERLARYVEEGLARASALLEHGAKPEAITMARRILSVLQRAATDENTVAASVELLTAELPQLIAILGLDEPLAYPRSEAKKCAKLTTQNDQQLLRCGHALIALCAASMLKADPQALKEQLEKAFQVAGALHDKHALPVLRYKLQFANLAMQALVIAGNVPNARQIATAVPRYVEEVIAAASTEAEPERQEDRTLAGQTLLMIASLPEGDRDTRRAQYLQVLTLAASDDTTSGHVVVVGARIGLAGLTIDDKNFVGAHEHLKAAGAILAEQSHPTGDVRERTWSTLTALFHLFDGEVAVADKNKAACARAVANLEKLDPVVNSTGRARLDNLRSSCNAL